MARMVGYACNIKLKWLNYAASLLEKKFSEEEYKEELNEYLAFEIDSPTRLRKTREILMRIWFYDIDEISSIRKEAVILIKCYPEYSSAIHLCLLYLAYPVVADICNNIGHLFEFQDYVTNAVLNQKLYDVWGNRTTLQTTCRRVTLTLKDMGILENETKLRYKLNRQLINNTDVINFMLYVAMLKEDTAYFSFVELTEFSLLFPFRYSVTKEQLIESGKFSFSNFGGELSISLVE